MKYIFFAFFAFQAYIAPTHAASGVSPLFTYGNYQRFDEITNLVPAVRTDEVELEETGIDGYLVQSSRKFYLSAGISTPLTESFPVENLYGWTSIGLFPSYNTFANTTQTVNSSEQITPFIFRLPKNPEDFDSLKIGDSFFWNAKLGLTLNLSVGISSVGVGPKVSIEGGYAVYVEKKSVNEVYIEILRQKTTSWGLLGGTFIAYAEMSKAISKAKGFSFLIDLSTESGKKAYLYLMHHKRLDLLQEASESSSVKIGDIDSLQTLNSKKMALLTPFIPLIEFKRSTEIELIKESREDIWDNKSQTVRAISVKQRTSRLFKKQSLFQTSALFETQDKNGIPFQQAQLHWFKKGNRMSLKRIRNALKRLIKSTGMKEEFSIRIPDRAPKKYAKVDFTLSLAPQLVTRIQKLYNLNTPKETVKYLQKSWNSQENFKKMISLIQNCGGSWRFEIAGQSFTRLIKEKKFAEHSSCEVSGVLF